VCTPHFDFFSLSLPFHKPFFSLTFSLSVFLYTAIYQICGGEEREIEESTLMLIKNGNQFICIDFFTAIPFRFAPVWLHK
jgi:hypothetical protein